MVAKAKRKIQRRKLTLDQELALNTEQQLREAHVELFDVLSESEARFVIAFFTTANLKMGEAAVQAGYQNAPVSANQLMRRPKVREAIGHILEQLFQKNDLVRKYWEIATYDPKPFYALSKGEKSLEDLEAEGVDTSIIKEIRDVTRKALPDEDGNPRYIVVGKKVTMMDKELALSTLMKLFTGPETVVNVSNDNRRVIVTHVPGAEERRQAAGLDIDEEGIIDIEAIAAEPKKRLSKKTPKKLPKKKVADYVVQRRPDDNV